jgi:hypothetical protein
MHGNRDVTMTPSMALALKLTVALPALFVAAWFAMEWWATRSADILIIEKSEVGMQPTTRRFVVSETDQAFMVGIDTFGSEDRNELWEKLQTGCRYAIRFIDQSRYPKAARRGLSGYFIFKASPLDCPGLPAEPAAEMPSAEGLLDSLTSPQKPSQP